MKVSLKWLADYVAIGLPPKELAHSLTMSGTEVGGIEQRGNGWPGVIVARVKSLDPHPTTESLALATIELPSGSITVVTGAGNLRVGDKVSYAPVGALLMDAHTDRETVVEAARIRGGGSRGGLC